ncbi:MAG TPA: flagellar export chaperone FliS [Alloacidobacterium sp.]|jgi:flagellar protein FliS|nr:flagellar export chaperone FliS [Alloacidobacterium sp.]
MQNSNYQQQSVAGMNGVELIIALYDGMVRFLHRAIEATEAGNVHERRIAVKRILDILMHLQSRLRMDVGGPAKTLSEFYAAVFALCLDGSRLSSTERFHEAIQCILRVREAWQQVAQDPEVRKQFTTSARMHPVTSNTVHQDAEHSQASGWTA